MTTSSLARRLLVVVSLVVSLAACGDDGTAAGPDAGPDAEPAPSEGVTVEHLYGSTLVPEVPQRIVSLDTQWTDVLLTLDAPLVGYLQDSTVDGGTFPWQEDRLDDATPVEAADALPFEQLAALDPDLIVITYLLQDEGEYDRLSEIAPTIPLLSDADQVDPWQDIAAVAGDVLDQPDQATAMVAAAEQRSADVLAELPGLEGKTFALANYVPGDALYVVADPDDGSSVFFAQVGLSIDPDILAIADGVSGRATLSLEQVSILDADLLVLFTNGADPADVPGYDVLPAVQAGAVAVLDYAAVVGLNTPTPLSIPYSLDLIRPALDAAA